MPNSAREITRGRKFEQVRRGASAIFLRDGFAGASVDDIARAAHVSKATLYTYFSDKSLMFQEVMSACAAEVFEARMDVAPVDDSPHDYLADFLADILTWQLSPESIRLHRLAIAEAHRFPDCVTNYLRLREATLVEPIRAQIDHWVLMGSLEPHDTERSSRTVASMLGGIPTHRALLGHTPDADRIRHTAEEVASLFLMVRAARPTAAE
ncbi:TetR/AcrR family transcriptional regulator [Paracoccus sp. 1_MG-2023]|uniref:TetR/AcrR family transcriptional regulator n=1 Tax=unclassified Paracoccus (in: a-proteobacteria) TaxID=2688777 RepID=UPI001C085F89|nr:MULTISPECIES: TetR/AcrR family transcriptional regulator [unclassified Paracoccus (in: a-proteobacteria)]MBU2956961.1 TetR/AcrR family transcriptional regulator [Paracoccus sp. C2R09]MDO6668158.1 TetR/AcrR family transcriptional regulator [Paracoccus sp. 1_MG-2023]